MQYETVRVLDAPGCHCFRLSFEHALQPKYVAFIEMSEEVLAGLLVVAELTHRQLRIQVKWFSTAVL